MRHLLIVALTAAALASPMRGEVITLICTDGSTYRDMISGEIIISQSEFQLDEELMTVWVSPYANPYPILASFWSDGSIGWMYKASSSDALYSHVLNVSTMILSTAVVSEEGIYQRRESCTRPL